MLRTLRTPALLAFALAAACSDPNALNPATESLFTDTLTLWSLERGPLEKPNAYSVQGFNGVSAVRTWEAGTGFDFVFSLDSNDVARFIPLGALGLGATGGIQPGLLLTPQNFDSIKKAPANGYLTGDTITVAEGQNYFLRTEILAKCSFVGVPLYAKIRVADIDTAAGTVTLYAVADQNCGYRGLVTNSIPKS